MWKYILFFTIAGGTTSVIKISDGSLAFPPTFKFGVATSSYQIEGAWNTSGKSQSIWDYYTHTFPSFIKDGSNGDIACDSYNHIDEDIKNLKLLHVNFYRFSLNWPRLLPQGGSTKINPDGLRYYNALINKLIANGIKPIITLYHWELPQCIQDLGGWTNRLTVDYFLQLARLAFEEFGDRVKTWVTINEPVSICVGAYEWQKLAPFIHSEGIGTYLCGHHLILAHAEAYHLYQKKFKEKQGGEVGITIESPWFMPLDKHNPKDVVAAEFALTMKFGWFANPIFSKTGNYPFLMRKRIDAFSKKQGFLKSRLPKFTREEIARIRGSADFLGFNHYTSYLVTFKINHSFEEGPSYSNDKGLTETFDPTWPGSARDIFKVYPHGLRNVLKYIKNTFDNPKVYITENGYAGYSNETINDPERIDYYKGYLNAVLQAIHLDGCNVQSYTAWSLMDNYEWFDGYSMRFGLIYVDFNDVQRKRTPKTSAEFYRNIIDTRRIPY